MGIAAVNAGPCGSNSAGYESSTPVLTWTLIMLWPHLARYYATRPKNPYMKMGPKCGGGNGKGTLW